MTAVLLTTAESSKAQRNNAHRSCIESNPTYILAMLLWIAGKCLVFA
jgi:hypothetical protein